MEIDMPTYVGIGNEIAATIAKVTKPLTDEQKTVMIGSLAVWLEAARKMGAAQSGREAPTMEGNKG